MLDKLFGVSKDMTPAQMRELGAMLSNAADDKEEKQAALDAAFQQIVSGVKTLASL